MAEIKQSDLNDLDVKKLSPDNQANLLEVIKSKNDQVNEEIKRVAESPELQTNVYSDLPKPTQNSEAAKSVSSPAQNKDLVKEKIGVQEQKNILNNLFEGRHAFEDIPVNEGNAADVMGAIADEHKE